MTSSTKPSLKVSAEKAIAMREQRPTGMRLSHLDQCDLLDDHATLTARVAELEADNALLSTCASAKVARELLEGVLKARARIKALTAQVSNLEDRELDAAIANADGYVGGLQAAKEQNVTTLIFERDEARGKLGLERAKVNYLKRALGEARDALAPFGKEALAWVKHAPNDYRPICTEKHATTVVQYTIGDLRTAARVHAALADHLRDTTKMMPALDKVAALDVERPFAKPCRLMTDDELVAEDINLATIWAQTRSGEGHGGSPGEWFSERSDEIATEQRRRAEASRQPPVRRTAPMAEHKLKTIGTVWDAVERGDKAFEVRRNDRFFQAGDTVVLQRLTDNGCYDCPRGERFGTRDLKYKIGWMLHGGQLGVEPGYVVFQLVATDAERRP